MGLSIVKLLFFNHDTTPTKSRKALVSKPCNPPKKRAQQVNLTIWLVVSIPLKNMKVGWHYYPQYMET
jgi:hypothetical protein